MNKYLLTCVLLLNLLYTGTAQVQPHHPDEWWPLGVNEYPGTAGYGNAWLRFINGKPVVQPAALNMNFEASAAVAADGAGKLLFYSNGCEIRTADGELMPNGEGLNPGELHDWVCGVTGYTAPRNMTALPWPGHPSRWVLLHLGGAYHPSHKMLYGPLYLTVIDVTANGGKGAVVSKNEVIATGNLEPFSIVRHGNGRDWWVVMPEYNTNRYQIRLLSPQGLGAPVVQSIGPAIGCRRIGGSAFSPDGSKYARTNSCSAVVLNFDRCGGKFLEESFLKDPVVVLPRDPGMLGGGGLAFSPDNRWLYATTDLCIFRADLSSDTPFLDSLYKRPYYFVDFPPVSEYVYGTSLTYMQQAPDGRIYMSSRHRERYYTRFTLSADDTYAFEPRGQVVPVPIVRTLPNFPNFRLYDLQGSICDTLGIDGMVHTGQAPAPVLNMQISPNPFDAVLQGMASESGLFRIYNAEGRLVHEALIAAGEYTLPTGGWPSGVYFWQFFAEGKSLVAGKVVKR